MSSIIFRVERSQVCVATDTLATSYDGKPLYFTNKAHIIPHLKMIIAGTGMARFLDRWLFSINNSPIQGIDALDRKAPNNLPRIWGELKLQIPIPDNLSTTVYHFGFSEVTGAIHAYAYRSENGFKSDRLKYGSGVNPRCAIPENFEFPTAIKGMMEEQRRLQVLLPKNEQVFVGGEIQIHHLMREGFNVYKLAEFDDYEEQKQAVYKT